jgi:ABC-type branched-subunit amino acid transport system substrate-binding protein
VKGQSGTGFIVTSYSATDEYKCSNDGRTKQSINGGNGSWKHDILIISAESYTSGEGKMNRAAIFTAVMVLIIFACSRHTATLGLTIPLPMTGPESKFGQIQKRSYEIAAAEINAQGGIKGKRLVLRFEDTRGKPEFSKEVAKKIVDVENQAILVG